MAGPEGPSQSDWPFLPSPELGLPSQSAVVHAVPENKPADPVCALLPACAHLPVPASQAGSAGSMKLGFAQALGTRYRERQLVLPERPP